MNTSTTTNSKPQHKPSTKFTTMQYLRYRAATIKRTLGVRVAAAYLRNCGVSLEGAVAILARG